MVLTSKKAVVKPLTSQAPVCLLRAAERQAGDSDDAAPRFVVTDEGVDFLHSIDTPVLLVAMAGSQRIGKCDHIGSTSHPRALVPLLSAPHLHWRSLTCGAVCDALRLCVICD